MNDLKYKYDEPIIDIVDILENLQKVDDLINKMKKQYREDNRTYDVFIQQYFDRKKKFEQELYVLLIQLNVPSDIFNIQFNASIEDMAEEGSNIPALKKSMQTYLQKVDMLFVHSNT